MDPMLPMTAAATELPPEARKNPMFLAWGAMSATEQEPSPVDIPDRPQAPVSENQYGRDNGAPKVAAMTFDDEAASDGSAGQ